MRTAFVTGASSDIGLAVCRRYLDAGWRVIGHFRTARPELEALAGPRFEPWRADFADTAGLEAALAETPGFFSRADALVNLAADMSPASFEEASAAAILRTLAINLVPGLLLMRIMEPAMAARGFGRIVHASSIGVKFGGGSDSFCYSLSKHAQEFIPSATRRKAAANVLVNVVRVGVTDTRAHLRFPGKSLADRVRLIPRQRAATPDEMAETLVWLGSEANATVTGQIIAASGGE